MHAQFTVELHWPRSDRCVGRCFAKGQIDRPEGSTTAAVRQFHALAA